MSSNRRKFVRRAIGYGATIFASDGSWSRKCRVIDISQSGAKLGLDQRSELPQNFVLALSERGGPTRRCRVMWTADEQVGVEFERPKKGGAVA
jgi:hypothetical protein